MNISDLHNDFFTTKSSIVENKINKYLDYIKKYNVKNINFAVWSTFLTEKETIGKLNKICEKNCTCSIEDISNINNFDELFKIKPICISLCWNYDNKYCGGAMGSNLGVTELGKSVIKIIENENIFIDTSHMSEKAFYDFLDITKMSIINTHSCVSALYNHKRNLTDNQIKEIYSSNGCLGITFCTNFYKMQGKTNSIDIFNNIDYCVQKFGINCVAIGSDFCGTKNIPYDINGYRVFENLFKIFLDNGYSKKAINMIFYQNYENTFKNNKN